VIGSAPSKAVTADILRVGVDTPTGDVHYVAIAQTTSATAPLVSPFSTVGRLVLDGLGRRVRSRGIDVNGLQYSDLANVTTAEIAAAQQWGANFVLSAWRPSWAWSGPESGRASRRPRIGHLADGACLDG
jgi:hypothetical protein